MLYHDPLGECRGDFFKGDPMESRIEQGYFSYPDVASAEAAVTEGEKIRRLERQLDYRRPQLVYTLYVKALEGNVFHTAEGFAYLLRIREYLENKDTNISGAFTSEGEAIKILNQLRNNGKELAKEQEKQLKKY